MSADRVTVHHGDSREVLKSIADCSVDSCVTDPPYALVSSVNRFGKEGSAPGKGDVYARASAGFMGKRWDTGETAFDPAFWAEVLRVLKPGAHIVAFSGTRTYHRLACAIEDGGFEIRDMVAWLYGSGFPKSHDVAKAIDKHLGFERDLVRVDASQVRNPKATGGGKDGMEGATRPWIERAREQGFHLAASQEAASQEAASWDGWGTALKPALEPVVLGRKPLDGTVAANVLQHATGALNIDDSRIGLVGGTPKSRSESKSSTVSVGGFLNAEAGELNGKGRWPANVIHDGSDDVVDIFPEEAGGGKPGKPTVHAFGVGLGTSAVGHDDSGSAARFFYSAKADAEDRLGSKHPTVKPVDLMAYLCRLITPPGGVVLDPFAGSGTTGLAAMREGFRAILIEREAEYIADIERRLAWARGEGRLTAQETSRHVDAPIEALPLFAEPSRAEPASRLRQVRQRRFIGPTGLRR